MKVLEVFENKLRYKNYSQNTIKVYKQTLFQYLKEVNYKDGNKLNNNIDNLEWMSDSENLKHARDCGLLSNKITKDVAKQIFKDKGTIRELAKKYNIGKTQIGYIKQGKRWKE